MSTLMNRLDIKLAARMLVEYPGLTVVGGLAMAFAIWAGVVTYTMVMLFVYPTCRCPLPNASSQSTTGIRPPITAIHVSFTTSPSGVIRCDRSPISVPARRALNVEPTVALRTD